MSEIDTSKGVRIYKIGAYPNFNSSSLAPNQINNLSHLSDADLYDNNNASLSQQRGKMSTSDGPDTARSSRNMNLVSEKTTPRSESQTHERVEVYEVNKKREPPRTRSGRVFAIRGTTKTIIEVTTTEVVEDNQFKVAPPSNLTSHRDLKPLDSTRSRSGDPNDSKNKEVSSSDEAGKKKKKKKKGALSSSDGNEDTESNGLKSKSGQSLNSDGSRRSQSRNSVKNASDSESKKSGKSKKSSTGSNKNDSSGLASSSDPDASRNKTGKLYSIELDRNKKKKKPKSNNNESTTDTEAETTQVKRIGRPGDDDSSDRNNRSNFKKHFDSSSLPSIENRRSNKSKSKDGRTNRSTSGDRLPFIIAEKQKPHVHKLNMRESVRPSASLQFYDPGYKRCPCLMHNRLYYMDDKPLDQEEKHHYHTIRDYWHDHHDYDLVYGRRFISNYPAKPSLKDLEIGNEMSKKTPWNPHGF